MALKHVMALLLVMMMMMTCFVAISGTSSSSTTRAAPRKLASWLDMSANGNAPNCWNALTEIKSCSNEIVSYFANGTAEIGPDCCQAITVITHNCWPAVLTTLGFTADETYILRGYCDATLSSAAHGPAQAPSLLS